MWIHRVSPESNLSMIDPGILYGEWTSFTGPQACPATQARVW